MRFPLPCRNFATSHAALLVSLDRPTTAQASIRNCSATPMWSTLGERLVAAPDAGQVPSPLLVRRTDGDQQQADGAEGQPAREGGGVRREQVQGVDGEDAGADHEWCLQASGCADEQDRQSGSAEQERAGERLVVEAG